MKGNTQYEISPSRVTHTSKISFYKHFKYNMTIDYDTNM